MALGSDRNNKKKRPIETITLSDSSDDEEEQRLSPPPRHDRSQAQGDVGEEEVEDAELQAAIRASLVSLEEEEKIKKQSIDQHEQQGVVEGASEDVKGKAKASNSIGGSSRAEMEKERLERVARMGITSLSGSINLGGGGGGSHNTRTPTIQTKRPRIATLSDLASKDIKASSSSSSASSSSSFATFSSSTLATTKRFWTGSILRVSNRYDPSTSTTNSYSFSSLIGPFATLRGSIVSAFVLDPEWVINHFPDNNTPLLLIMPRSLGDPDPSSFVKMPSLGLSKPEEGSNEVPRVLWQREEVYRTIPKMVKRETPFAFSGCMHTKLLVYFHDDFCRIVIPSANAISYDWDIIDNAFYVQDFPLLQQPLSSDLSPNQNPTLTQFSGNFIRVIEKFGASKGFLKFFKDYDFSKSDQIRLVHSMHDKPYQPERFDTGGGLASLAKTVSSLGFAKGGKWEFEATGSSIGRYSPTWLIQFLSSCSGIHPNSYFIETTTRPATKTSPLFPHSPNTPRGQPYNYRKLPLKIIYPTRSEILNSYQGPYGGGTIFFPRSRWLEKNFPRELLYKGQSKRDRVAAHTKMILATHTVESKDGSATIYEGYVYVGSHNLTPSAWGSLQDGMGGKQLVINNYELGVIVPIRATTSKEEFEKQADDLVTYKRPLERFGPNDLPWMQEDFPEIYNKDQPTRPGARAGH